MSIEKECRLELVPKNSREVSGYRSVTLCNRAESASGRLLETGTYITSGPDPRRVLAVPASPARLHGHGSTPFTTALDAPKEKNSLIFISPQRFCHFIPPN